tara:strand:+ start:683 stop:1444 length:762 start_codon:yes stop_codon:yes gene_type:complete
MTTQEALEKIKHLLFGQQKFGLMKSVDGVEVKVEGDIELEKEIYIITPDGEIPAPDGEFEMEDGMKVRVLDGKVDRIDYVNETEVEDEVMEEEVEVEVEGDTSEDVEVTMVSAELIDGTLVETDGELVVGAELYVKTEEGRTIAPDGEHETKDGAKVTIVDGIITDVVVEDKVEVDVEMSQLLEAFTSGFEILNSELSALKEKYETMRGEFSQFSGEPAGERQYLNGYVEQKKLERFGKLEQLAKLKSNKRNK